MAGCNSSDSGSRPATQAGAWACRAFVVYKERLAPLLVRSALAQAGRAVILSDLR